MNIRTIISMTLVSSLAVACAVDYDEGDYPADDYAEADDALVEAERGDVDAAPAPGTCSCNPAPDSSGNWAVDTETCSLCTNSADCATASCKYKHAVHGGTREVGCRYSSSMADVDAVEAEAVF